MKYSLIGGFILASTCQAEFKSASSHPFRYLQEKTDTSTAPNTKSIAECGMMGSLYLTAEIQGYEDVNTQEIVVDNNYMFMTDDTRAGAI